MKGATFTFYHNSSNSTLQKHFTLLSLYNCRQTFIHKIFRHITKNNNLLVTPLARRAVCKWSAIVPRWASHFKFHFLSACHLKYMHFMLMFEVKCIYMYVCGFVCSYCHNNSNCCGHYDVITIINRWHVSHQLGVIWKIIWVTGWIWWWWCCKWMVDVYVCMYKYNK